MHLSVLAEIGAKPALPAEPGQLAGPGARDHEPVAADQVPLDPPHVLEQKRALPPAHAAAYALDPDEAGRPVSTSSLQELDGAIASDIARKAFLNVDPGQHRALGGLVVARRLVLVHCDQRVRASSGRNFSHAPDSFGLLWWLMDGFRRADCLAYPPHGPCGVIRSTAKFATAD